MQETPNDILPVLAGSAWGPNGLTVHVEGRGSVGRAKAGGTGAGGKVSYHERKIEKLPKSTTCAALSGTTGPTRPPAQPLPQRLVPMDLASPY